MSKATVDSTEYIPITDLDSPPVITLCPRQEYDEEKLKEWGYCRSYFFCIWNCECNLFIESFLLGNNENRNNCNFLTFNYKKMI